MGRWEGCEELEVFGGCGVVGFMSVGMAVGGGCYDGVHGGHGGGEVPTEMEHIECSEWVACLDACAR